MQSQIARANNHMQLMRTGVDNTSWRVETSPNTQVWVQATSDRAQIDGDGNGAGYKRDATGGTVGLEHMLETYDVLIGMAFSYDWENWTAMGNKNKNNTGYMDFYVRKDVEKWHHYGLFGLSQTGIDAFITDSSTRFTMEPAKESRYGAMIGADINMPYDKNTSFYIGGTYEFKSDATNVTANAGVIYTF